MYFSRAISALAVAIALAGCGSHKTTVLTSTGAETVTTSQDGKTATVDTKDGTMTVGGDVDPASLGAPIYPGANKNGSGNIAVSGANGAGAMASFKTGDPFDKVYAFYKAHLPADAEKSKVEENGTMVAAFQIIDTKSGDQTSVMVEGKAVETDILITHGSGKYGASSSPTEDATP
ncbi:MAG TPA: hypothetical protein VGN11_05855 [Candidatus Baltobacteraceae bacterium]|jgi:hypothetical protein|nr:hypothetical protein [Candidatus Baltobacteraceae bacterium]